MSPKVLLVAAPNSGLALLEELASIGVVALRVGSCREARALLRRSPAVEVVVTEPSLPDGNWSEINRYLVANGIGATLVVNAPQASETLWSEVIWRGAYDLLVEPYEPEEVRHCIEGAIRRCQVPGTQATTLDGVGRP